MSASRLATDLLPRVLDAMGLLGARLEAALGSEGQADSALELEALRLEVEDLGWALSLLSAVGAGQPNLARHHRDGLRVLLGLLFPGDGGLPGCVPELESDPGAEFAWALSGRLAQLGGGFPVFEQGPDHWRIGSVLSPGSGPVGNGGGWLEEHGLAEVIERDQWSLLVPIHWLQVRLSP